MRMRKLTLKSLPALLDPKYNKSGKGFQTVLKFFKTMEEKEDKIPNCKKVPEKTSSSVQKLQECASVSNVPTSDVLPAKCLKSFPAKNIYFKKTIGTPKGVKTKKNITKCKNAKTNTKFEDIRNFFEPKSSFLSQTSKCIAQASCPSTIVPETSPEPQHLHKLRETERIKEIRSLSF